MLDFKVEIIKLTLKYSKKKTAFYPVINFIRFQEKRVNKNVFEIL